MMDLASFKEMIGILGNFELSERMFGVIDEDKDQLISLEQYLVYNDKLNNGTQDEKIQLTFKMIDAKNRGKVEYEDFKLFWMSFIELYSIANQSKLQYEEHLIKYAFD